MIAATLADVHELVRDGIEAITPRTPYKSSAWNSYASESERRRNGQRSTGPGTGSRSRRFRLLWDAGAVATGVHEAGAREQLANLVVRVEYQGTPADQLTIDLVAADDWQQLRDELTALKGPSSPVLLVEHGDAGPQVVAVADHPDIAAFDLPFVVRYLQQTRVVI